MQGTINQSSGTKTYTFARDISEAYALAGQNSMEFYLNDVQIPIEIYGTPTNYMGLYKSSSFSIKKGDVLSVSIPTSGTYGYMIFIK